MKKIFFIIIPLITIFVLFLFYYSPDPKFKTIEINGVKIEVEVPQTDHQKNKGLSGRESLSHDKGMIFVFKEADHHSFWMKNMNFPLDFIWIKDNKIVDITEKVQPVDFQPPKVLKPEEKVNIVLEVNSGFVEENNIKVGEKIFLQ